MFEIFKKKENEVATINTPDIRRIEVRDLKEYLVEEIERTNTMQRVLDSKEREIERLEIEEEKYKATLILTDEYSKRLENYEERLSDAHGKIADLQEKLRNEKDNVNDLKIQYSRLEMTEEQIRDNIQKELVEDCCDLIISNIHLHKGALSKAKAIEMVENAKNRRTLKWEKEND